MTVDTRQEAEDIDLDRFIFRWFNDRDPNAMRECLDAYEATVSALSPTDATKGKANGG